MLPVDLEAEPVDVELLGLALVEAAQDRNDRMEFHGQCLKWRMPVNSIAMSDSSAAAITSSSRTEPPGWTTARAPAAASTSTPSRNGKNASDATALPASFSPALRSLIRTESTRDIWPAPMPTVTPSFANTIAFDFTRFA